MPSKFTLTLTIANPVWWLWTFRSRRREARQEAERQARLQRFHEFILEPEDEPMRYDPRMVGARPEAPPAPFDWGGNPQGARVEPKERIDVVPETVVRVQA